MVTYFLATDNPHTWTAASPIENIKDSKIVIKKLTPLKPYTVFLRGFIEMDSSIETSATKMYSLTKISEPIRCATQGLDVSSNFSKNRIFIWWTLFNSDNLPDNLILQFWHNDSTNPTIFSDHIIGTNHEINKNWNEIESNLVKIPATTSIHYQYNSEEDDAVDVDKNLSNNRKGRSFDFNSTSRQTFESLESEKTTNKNLNDSNKSVKDSHRQHSNITITEVRIPGNITGILIPNTNKIVVRVIATITDHGKVFEQDYSLIEWKTFDFSDGGRNREFYEIKEVKVESRSIAILYNSVQSNQDLKNRCMKICYETMSAENLIRSEKKIDCKDM